VSAGYRVAARAGGRGSQAGRVVVALLLATIVAAAAKANSDVDEVVGGGAGTAPAAIFGTFEAPPFAIRTPEGALTGYLGDYLEALHRATGLHFEIRFHRSLSELKQALNDGRVALGGPLVQTPDAPLRASFTQPLERLPMKILVGPAGGSRMASLQGLSGKRVAVLQAGRLSGFLDEAAQPRLIAFETDVDALEALSLGRIDAAVLESRRAAHYLGQLHLSQIRAVGEAPFAYEPAIAVGEDQPALRAALEEGMKRLPASTLSQIRRRWLELPQSPWYRSGPALVVFGVFALGLMSTSFFYALKFLRQSRQRDRQLREQRKRLERSERMYRALASSISDMVTIHRSDGRILYASPSTLGLTGYDRRALIGRNLVEFLHPEDRADAQAALAVLGPGVEQRRTLRVRCRNGMYRYFESVAKLFDAGHHGEFVVVSRDVTERIRVNAELKQAHERYRRLAFHDPRTGLPNRVGLTARMRDAVRAARRGSRALAVMFLDIDNLKTVNDAHGYSAGDEIVEALAARLLAATRGQCELARAGGDEFVAIVDEDEPAALERLASVMIEACVQPIPLGDDHVYLSASVGIARYPSDGMDGESLVASAGIALRAAKDAGKSTWRHYDAEIGRRATGRAASLRNLRGAFERGEFSLHYQPKVSLETGRICGYEALLRWETADGPRGTFELVVAAEQSGFITTLGDWVLREAARQSLAWRAAGAACPIAVNVSVAQLNDPRFLAVLRELTAQDPALPGQLVLELTESTLAAEVDRTLDTLDALSAMGFALHIDDFGTGFSSLARLSRMPVSALKIDRSFVTATPGDTDACEIVRAIVALARSLRLQVVAEGIETTAQLQFLRSCGCEQGQGYLFGHPMRPAEALMLWQDPLPLAGRAGAAEAVLHA